MRCQCRSWLVNFILVISVALFVMLVLAGCALRPTMPLPVWRESVVAGIRGNSAAIAVYYTISEEEYQRRLQKIKDGSIHSRGLLIVPTRIGQEKAIAYIGGGTLLKDNHALTVRHLFVHDEGAIRTTIWVMLQDLDHPVEAEVVALSAGEKNWDDYAVIKLKESLNIMGAPVALASPAPGEDVALVGSVGGSAFFMRFVRATRFQKYFRRDSDAILHLSQYEDFPFICTYPGGPGDSGGGVFNTRGELVGVMYCGVEIYAENYIFSNPVEVARDFLTKNGLAGLLK